MSPAPVDDLSRLDPSAAGAAAGTLTGTAVSAEVSARALTAARSSVPHWHGPALAAFEDASAGAGGSLDLLTRTARAGARLLGEHARQLELRRARVRLLLDRAADVERRLQRGDALGSSATWAADWEEADRVRRVQEAVLQEQDRASRELAHRLDALIADVAGRPRSWGEHLTDGAGAFVEEGIVQPAVALGTLAFGWVRDPGGWWRTVRSVPGAHADDVRHPVRTAARELHVEDFRAGRTGEGFGALAAALATRGLTRGLSPPRRGRRGGSPQSLDELFAGVDLDLHELHPDAHTLERHVDVDDRYLRDRLVLGTLTADGTRKLPAPPSASRWTDRATAERHLHRILRDHEQEVRRLAGAGALEIKITAPVPPSAGSVMTRTATGFSTSPPTTALVVLRPVDGSWTVMTAYLKGSS